MSDKNEIDDFQAAAIFNDAILKFSGRVAERYIFTQQQQQSKSKLLNHIGEALALPPDLEVAKKVLLSTMSALYAMMLIVLCLVFTSTEIITKEVPLDFFESYGFYTYLYSLSVIFFIYLFGYVVRSKYTASSKNAKKLYRLDSLNVDAFLKRMSQLTNLDLEEVNSDHPHHRNFSLRKRIENSTTCSPNKPSSNVHDNVRQRNTCVKLMTSENDKSHGCLFLRLGTVAFGLGTLIYAGLEFLTFFETPQTCLRWEILEGINPVLYMIFVFMQMYFIFTHCRININKNKAIAKFGMMHVIATNVCMVIRTLVKESAKEIFKSGSVDHPLNSNKVPENECEKLDIIGDTFEHSSIYLFPFIIEYSIIGCAVIYQMWSHIGKNPTYLIFQGDKSEGNPDDLTKHRPYHLDWSSSSVGLFMGLLSLVGLIISLILYFALVNQEKYRLLAVLINNIMDTLINGLMILAMIFGFYQTRKLSLVRSEKDYDIISIISASGIVVYAAFTVIAGMLNQDSLEPSSLVIINGVFEIVEVNIQLLFIADLKQRVVSEANKGEKPGRQTTTYLLMCNLALWVTYNFEIQKGNATPDQSKFYGFLPWVVIQRITLPLCVFFRFHSSVVLTELWKNCYRLKRVE
ncbi:proton channel OtopLc isoform X2 [Lepeophtheirus salmonis]|uniref:proton channel OtopLc isoform X2 n=1 Tax=Lepeophtheirus salmonis TaxID=72036 RepID=UPI001AEB4C1B|nr:proton channel OtopLc-like isoform X2 [Lepeophtheirus salmonis]